MEYWNSSCVKTNKIFGKKYEINLKFKMLNLNIKYWIKNFWIMLRTLSLKILILRVLLFLLLQKKIPC